MAKLKLTATTIQNHKPKSANEILNDGDGLSMRFRLLLTESTDKRKVYSKTWIYSYKVGTKSLYITLGSFESLVSEFDREIYGLHELPKDARLTLEIARMIVVGIQKRKKLKIDPKDYIQQEIDKRERAKQKLIDDELERLAAIAKKNENDRLLKIKADAENLTVQHLFDAWIADGVRRKDDNATLLRTFKADVLPQIGKIAIKDLTEHHVRGLLRVLVKRGVNRSAVIMRNNLTQMFAWAEKRQPWRKLLSEGNPIDLIEMDKIVDRDYDMKNERHRKLSPDEIKELKDIFIREQLAFDTAPDRRSARHPVETSFQCAIWIMLSTLCRVGEMSMARWENVDFEARTWFIPKADTKGEENDLTIFLSDFSLDQFRKLHTATGHSDWLFPARNHDGHVCVKSMSKRVGDRQSMFKRDADGLARKPMSNRRQDNTFLLGEGKEGAWTPHDLRRTGATMMQSLGVPLDIIDRCQNHVLSGSKVRRAYLQHDYAKEKRDAWRLLGDRLALILNPADNVITLERRA
nr:tyrosine-type recombinase/integrase [uncultured Undibacterium sp.]